MVNAQSTQRQLFDFDWKFSQTDQINAQLPPFNDASWRNVDLPHDWSIEGKIAHDNPIGGAGGFFPAGVGWYRRTFSAPPSWAGKTILIEFDGVYMNSDVWLNGRLLGNHPNGYTPFYYDLTPNLLVGADNTIAVRVDNSKYVNSRWYTGSGIYRHVWIHVDNPIHIIPCGTQLNTSDITHESAKATLRITIRNDSIVPRQIAVSSLILSPANQSIAQQESNISIPAGNEQQLIQTFDIQNPQLWMPDSPHLYQALTSLKNIDENNTGYRTIFGIRDIKVSPEKGFELNGQTLKLCGACVHHDNGCLGAAAFDRAEQRKVELLKSAGFNAVRTAHNPPSPAFLNACDRLGLLVMDEAFDCWDQGKTAADYSIYFHDWWQRDLDAMVLRDRNHPSIIMWSLGNEIPNAGTPDGIRIGTMLADHLRTLDDTRPLTSAFMWWKGKPWSWEQADPLFAKLDVSGYNYQLQSYQPDHLRIPSRVMLSTESYPHDAYNCWKLANDNSYMLGDFVWSGMDYLGESGIGRYYLPDEQIINHGDDRQYPCHGAYCGDIDLTGWRKPISHYRNIICDRGEKLYTAVLLPLPNQQLYKVAGWGLLPAIPSWTWPGYEAKNLNVIVYSRCDRVQLYLNDKLVGEQPTSSAQEFKAAFTVPYIPGILKTVGLQGDQPFPKNELSTVGIPAAIRLTPDRASVSADGQDLSFISVEALDKDGHFQPNADQSITFTITGPGIIAGVGSGDCSREQMYQGNQRRLFHGRAQVVIRASQAAGKINVSASSSGLSSASTEIDSLSAAK